MITQTPDQDPSTHRVHESVGGPGPGTTPGRPGAESKVDPHREDLAGPVRNWNIEIPFAGQWLTSNRSSSYRYGAAEWRNAATVACIRARLPKRITPVRLHLICWYETSRAPVRDRLNLAPTIKAIVDGLTPTVASRRNGKPHSRGGYGLLPDDSDKHVLATTWAIVPGLRPYVDLYITHEPATPE